MRKLLLLFLLVSAFRVHAQSWAAPGATWYYDYTYFSCSGYERISKVGDTIINGHQYDQLETYRKFICQSPPDTSDSTEPNRAFTRLDSNRVYLWRDSMDYVLYDFNLQPGGSWLCASQIPASFSTCDTGTIVVTSLTSMIVNGDTLKGMYTTPVDFTGLTFGGQEPIVEKLGGLINLFPYPNCVPDLPQGYYLRCYSDSSGWSWHSPYFFHSCDNMVGIREITPASPVIIVTEPVLQKITVHCSALPETAMICVYNANGRLLKTERITAGESSTELFLPGMSDGLYLVTVSGASFHFSSRVLVAD